uniref:Uncharacterized protein n=1 Tax=Physcomitrium patens TaxID=3218 RepID=A0A2K1J9B7_PHYPA|nr:hypothetical protein PHYPA_021218 [Physcomitrium patens]
MVILTVGILNTIRRLAPHKFHSMLVVSLHAPNQGLRSKLVPSANRYSLDNCDPNIKSSLYRPCMLRHEVI